MLPTAEWCGCINAAGHAIRAAAIGVVLICAIAIGIIGCSPAAVFIDDAFMVDMDADFPALNGMRFGGLSGLAFDVTSGELFAISDDRVDNRIVRLRVREDPFRVEPAGVIPLDGGPAGLDPEGLVLLENGHFLVTSEGGRGENAPSAPAILEYRRDGTFVRALEIPERFTPSAHGDALRGVRENAAFESLTVTADGRTLFTATESSLHQDGEPADFDRGARVRLLEYRFDGDTFIPGAEYVYEQEAMTRPDFPSTVCSNSLAELVALDDTELLSLEHGFAEASTGGRVFNRCRVYRVSIAGASDVSGSDSIAGRTDFRPVSKQLLFDLSETPGLPHDLAGLDNFEGLALYPENTAGRRRLLLVSDDNFSDRQRTWFVRVDIP